jgi:hypothetical protein
MIDWIKDKIVLIFLILSIGGNVYLLISGGIKITNVTTSMSSSSSYSTSGSFVLNLLGQQIGQFGTYEIKKKQFNSIKEMDEFIKGMNISDFSFAKINDRDFIVRYVDFSQIKQNEGEANAKTTAPKVKGQTSSGR